MSKRRLLFKDYKRNSFSWIAWVSASYRQYKIINKFSWDIPFHIWNLNEYDRNQKEYWKKASYSMILWFHDSVKPTVGHTRFRQTPSHLKCMNFCESVSLSCRLDELCSVKWWLCFCAAMSPYLTDQRKDYKSYVVSSAGILLPAKLICRLWKISQSHFNRPIQVMNTCFLNNFQVNTGTS